MNVVSRKPVTSLVKFKTAKKHVNSHAESQKTHFIQRFYERMGYKLTDAGYARILELLSSNETSRFLYKSADIGSVYNVRFEGHLLRVVYDAFKKSLITVLPKPR